MYPAGKAARFAAGLSFAFSLWLPAAHSHKKRQTRAQLRIYKRWRRLGRQTSASLAGPGGKSKQGDYVIGGGDLLGIEVFDVPEFSREVRVNESGFVSIPLVPVKVQAAGLTTFQFQDKLAELLQSNGLVTHPQVTVTVKEQHSEPITVIGAVKTPLTLQAVHQITLLQVLSQAGGITDDAGSKVLITRVRRLPEPATPDPGTPAPRLPIRPIFQTIPRTTSRATPRTIPRHPIQLRARRL